MRPRALIAVTSLAVTAAAEAQKVPAFRIADSVRIDARKEELVSGDLKMALRADGSIAIASRGARLVYLDSTGKRLWTRALRDVAVISEIGWRGDSLMVIDNYREEAVALGSNAGVGKSLVFPDIVRPRWKDRYSLHAYGGIDAVAVTADDQLIGAARGPRRLGMYGPKAMPDPAEVQVLRVDLDGVVQRRLGKVMNAPKQSWSILRDGRLVVLILEADSLSVTTISPAGDTLFARRRPKPRGLFGAVGGPDGTIWITTGGGTAVLTHTALDARGNVLGSIDLPVSLRAGAGDARHLWMFGAQGNNRTITRYTLK